MNLKPFFILFSQMLPIFQTKNHNPKIKIARVPYICQIHHFVWQSTVYHHEEIHATSMKILFGRTVEVCAGGITRGSSNFWPILVHSRSS
ncbi:hypothetical protein ES332_A13G194800v1 [Gossypium tomentosum]|uniref:Uncharacterized protein n=1 Tax=Gossypium tomentosum TaxID=34277 RepID=A0A5D2MME9_GOSTO|nr:hypothetical protein ES332_A13G194800v1 [Gossypium tomentosum]